jgi:hypothetical protein
MANQFSVERSSLEKQIEDEYERQNEHKSIIQTLMEEKNSFQGNNLTTLNFSYLSKIFYLIKRLFK